MNYMKQIAEMLGVELDEEFEIEGREGRFYITPYGLYNTAYTMRQYIIFNFLLTGTDEIVKLPWKPKTGEKFYAVTIGGEIYNYEWYGTTTDVTMYAFGNCFRTHEEAGAHKEEMLAKMKEVMGE